MGNKFDIFTEGRKYISPTQAGMLTGKSACPAKWSFRYEQKVKGEPSKAMLLGKLFDSYCEGKPEVQDGLFDVDVATVIERYHAYISYIPKASFQAAIEIDLDYHDWFVRGFIDILPDSPDTPFIEVKLATTPWQRKKIAYNRMQIITYAQATGRPGEFHVSNMAKPGVQVFTAKDYLPRGKDQAAAWKAVRKDYMKAIRLIESDDREPRPNILCKGKNENATWQCDYYDLCQAEIKAKEMRIDELSKVL